MPPPSRDAGPATPDGGVEDAGDGGAGADAATRPDGAPPLRCDTFTVSEPIVRASTYVSPDDAPSLATRDDGALVAWVGRVDEQPRLSVLQLSFDGLPSVSGVSDAPSSQRDPAIVATADGYVVVWRDDRDGDFELLARAVGPDGVASETLHVITENAVDDGPPGVGLDAAGQVVVAWVERGSEPVGRLAVLGSDGAVRGRATVDELAGAAGPPATGPLPAEGAALAWVDDASRRVRVQRIGADGQPVGALMEIAAEGQAHGAVDLASRAGETVLVYDVNVAGTAPEVRYQQLDEAAAPIDRERILTPSSSGTGASLAPVASGYATAYRSADGASGAVLRLALFETGADEVLQSMEVDDVTLSGTRPIVRAAPDGTKLALAWVEDGRAMTAQARCR